MKAIHRVNQKNKQVKLDEPALVGKDNENMLKHFETFVSYFNGSTRWLGMQLYAAFNGLIISDQYFHQMSLQHAAEHGDDNSLIEHIYENQGIFHDSEVCDHEWFVTMMSSYNCKTSVQLAVDYFSDQIGEVDPDDFISILKRLCCAEAGKCAIDSFEMEEMSVEDCKICVQNCAIAGTLDPAWMKRFKEACDSKGYELDSAWLKAYDNT
jgi:hypothetical protein